MEEPNHSPIIEANFIPNTLSFPEAMQKVIDGKKVRRQEWPSGEYGYLKDGWLTVQRKAKEFRWLVSDGDMLSDDWEVINA